jgi:SAM-dependent methyltransferase
LTSGTELAKLYRIRFDEADLPRKEAIWKVLCGDFLQRFVPASATVLDLACGYGEFINNIVAARRIGVDLNPDSKGRLRPGIEFRALSAAELSKVGAGSVDVVFTSNFLEHLPDKAVLDRVLEEVWATLAPGGRFVVLGPNLRYLPGEYWDFYDHQLPLTHLSLAEALQLKGFDIELVIDRFLPYTTRARLPTHPWLVRLYLKVPFAWRFFGKQFFVVGVKSADAPRAAG